MIDVPLKRIGRSTLTFEQCLLSARNDLQVVSHSSWLPKLFLFGPRGGHVPLPANGSQAIEVLL